MKLVVQRVKMANVEVEGKVIGDIKQGFMVLIGVAPTDTKEIADFLVQKLIHLRIFEDENGKMNLSIQDINGELLLVSQFTLYADCSHGNRPSFVGTAAEPKMANELYEYFVEQCKKENIKKVATGEFGADMQVTLQNDGPVTIILEK